MKRYCFILAALLVACAPAGRNDGDYLKPLQEGWRGKTIQTGDQGAKPHVLQLLRAFDAAWPVPGADSLLAEAGDRTFVSGSFLDGDSGKVQADSAMATYNQGITLDKRVEARVYPRDNGHTLFVVSLVQADPERTFCCFYDYDPKRGTLTPEEEPYAGFKPRKEDSIIDYWITEDDAYGDDIIIVEISSDDSAPPYYYHFVFDGMKHGFSGSTTEFIYPDYSDSSDGWEEEEEEDR